MADHAFLAPSSASIWGPGGCPAHPRMAQQFPEDGENEAAREGTAAHEYIAAIIRDGEILDAASNGHPITDEIVECVADITAAMQRVIARDGVRWAVEQRVEMVDVHAENWGTADFIAVDPRKKCVWVFDYKHGHKDVPAFENWQLLDYAVGAAAFYKVQIDDEWIFDLRVYQPRSYHGDGPVKRWTINGGELVDYRHQLAAAAVEATKPDAPMATGEHCDYCPARHACPALQRVGGRLVDMSLQGLPNELTPADAGVALRMLNAASDRLKALQTGLAAQVEAAIRDGQIVPGWSFQQGYGREKWTIPAEDVFAIGDAQGVDVRKPPEAITPAQAVKKGFDATVKKAYSEKPIGAKKLVAVDSKDVRKAFTTKGSNTDE